MRQKRPHPGVQYNLFDPNGYRHIAFLADTPGRGNDLPALELRHREHARVKDRPLRQSYRLRNLPCRGSNENVAWVELALTAAELLTWAQALCFDGELRPRRPATLRHRVLHTAGRLIVQRPPPPAQAALQLALVRPVRRRVRPIRCRAWADLTRRPCPLRPGAGICPPGAPSARLPCLRSHAATPDDQQRRTTTV